MAEEEKATVSQEEQDYIQIIEDLKKNTVDKAEYDRVVADRKKILNAYVNGEKLEKEEKTAPFDIKKETDALLFGENNNLNYARKALAMREHFISEGKGDIFLPRDPTRRPSADQVQTAKDVAEVLQECIDVADGDPDVFNRELQRRCIDPVRII